MTDLHMSQAFANADIADHGNHAPGDDDWWQESAFFNLCDPNAGVIGYYRIGRHPNLGVGNSYYWTTAQTLGLDDKQFMHGQPLPAGDVTNTTVAGLTIEAIRPMEEYRIVVNGHGYRVDVNWQPFFWPIMVHTAVKGGAGIANKGGHYNTLGRAVGHVEKDGQRVEIDAYGYLDHSWGVRKDHFPASKWIQAIADAENFLHVFVVSGVDGASRFSIGYACRDGKLRRLTDDFETGFTMRDDWVTPAACDARFVDEDGRTYHVKGRATGAESIYPFLHGKFCVHVLADFDLDGKPAKGLLENTNPWAIPSVYTDRYAVADRSMWTRAPGEIADGPGATVELVG
jgi:hypothetical protein